MAAAVVVSPVTASFWPKPSAGHSADDGTNGGDVPRVGAPAAAPTGFRSTTSKRPIRVRISEFPLGDQRIGSAGVEGSSRRVAHASYGSPRGQTCHWVASDILVLRCRLLTAIVGVRQVRICRYCFRATTAVRGDGGREAAGAVVVVVVVAFSSTTDAIHACPSVNEAATMPTGLQSDTCAEANGSDDVDKGFPSSRHPPRRVGGASSSTAAAVSIDDMFVAADEEVPCFGPRRIAPVGEPIMAHGTTRVAAASSPAIMSRVEATAAACEAKTRMVTSAVVQSYVVSGDRKGVVPPSPLPAAAPMRMQCSSSESSSPTTPLRPAEALPYCDSSDRQADVRLPLKLDVQGP